MPNDEALEKCFQRSLQATSAQKNQAHLADLKLDDPELRRQAVQALFGEKEVLSRVKLNPLDSRPCRHWVRQPSRLPGVATWQPARIAREAAARRRGGCNGTRHVDEADGLGRGARTVDMRLSGMSLRQLSQKPFEDTGGAAAKASSVPDGRGRRRRHTADKSLNVSEEEETMEDTRALPPAARARTSAGDASDHDDKLQVDKDLEDDGTDIEDEDDVESMDIEEIDLTSDEGASRQEADSPLRFKLEQHDLPESDEEINVKKEKVAQFPLQGASDIETIKKIRYGCKRSTSMLVGDESSAGIHARRCTLAAEPPSPSGQVAQGSASSPSVKPRAQPAMAVSPSPAVPALDEVLRTPLRGGRPVEREAGSEKLELHAEALADAPADIRRRCKADDSSITLHFL